jgi:hypothetical protein
MSQVTEVVIAMMATEIIKLREELLLRNASHPSHNVFREDSQAVDLESVSFVVRCRSSIS